MRITGQQHKNMRTYPPRAHYISLGKYYSALLCADELWESCRYGENKDTKIMKYGCCYEEVLPVSPVPVATAIVPVDVEFCTTLWRGQNSFFLRQWVCLRVMRSAAEGGKGGHSEWNHVLVLLFILQCIGFAAATDQRKNEMGRC